MTDNSPPDALHDRNVGRDVRELGALLGNIIEDQTSREVFETVERLRTTAIEYRAGNVDSRTPLQETLEGLDPETGRTVARAFTTYFELINLAEERERVRSFRRDSHEGTLEESLESTAATLAELDPETAAGVLGDVLIQPTFTAHPTEARRKTIKAKLRAVASSLETLDERRLTHKEARQVRRALSATVRSLWQTPQIRDRRPEPTDEARNVQWYLENTLFDVVPEVYEELEHALGMAFEDPPSVPSLLEFRSWAGGDRDGNPHVTPAVTADTLERQRAAVLARYRDALAELSTALSQDGRRLAVTESVLEGTPDVEPLREIARRARERYPNEPYRQRLQVMRERLARVDDLRPGGYDSAEELATDLRAIADSLRENGAADVAETHVDPVIRQLETFRFSLATLDLRDHREQHTRAIDELLAAEGIEYGDLDEDERVDVLTDLILQDEAVLDLSATEGLSPETSRVAERFAGLADWQAEYGPQAVDTYCISMTEEPSHVMEVLFLADQVGVVDLPDWSGLDVVPLLETESALSGARRIVGTLFENEAYRQALDARGTVQEVMLGYSDSNKENGFLAANWSLYRNQRRLAEIADDHDVTLRLFHGRGGSISRGGGPMNDALQALPDETVTGSVKFTEQGEAIAETYGNPRIAERNVEQMLDAQIRSRKRVVSGTSETIEAEWIEAMETMAAAARAEYRDLLETEGFVAYFRQATPISVIEDLNLGSRPASRSSGDDVADLRAIPWVFSWTQSRCILPGWYSLATGIEAYLEDGGDLAVLREMYDEWPFFETMLDSAAGALGRTELEIAAEYAQLADEDVRERFEPRIRAEYEDAVGLVTEIARRDDPIEPEWLRESLERRNPYVDPLNLLQTRLLDRDERSQLEEQTLRLTVKGIAAGMQSTG